MSCHGGTVVAHPPLALELRGGCDAGVGAQAQAGAAVGLQAPPLPGEHSSRLEQAAPSLVSPVLIYSAIPPFLPGPPPPCTSPSYESEKGRLTLGGRQPAAGSTGQVPPQGGRPAANTLHKHMRQPRLQAEAAPEDETLMSRELDVLVKDNTQQSRRTVGRARSGKYAAELDGRSSCGGKK